MNRESAKRLVIDMLDYFRFKVMNDECSIDEIDSVAETLAKELNVRGTIKDFADFYGQSESNVRNLLSRRYVPGYEKPQRKVTYRFGFLESMIPRSWRK